MKHNLGKILLLCCQLIWLHASDFDYAIYVDKSDPYVKEATLVNIELNQTNHDIVLLFDFDLIQSPDYTFQRVDIEEVDAYHAAHIRYTYLVYPLHEGKVSVHFRLTQKATTDESVAYSFSGDRDNVKGLVTTDTIIPLEPLALNVKPLPKGTQIVGDFSLNYTVKKHQAQAFEPLPLQVNIQGKGYPPVLQTLLAKDGNFTRFTESPVIDSMASTQGTTNHVSYVMAFSSEHNFTLPPLVIKAFNPLTQKTYELVVPKQDFHVLTQDKTSLLDKVDSPVAFTMDWSWLETFLGYLVVFVAGYLSAWSWRWKGQSMQSKHPLNAKIQGANTYKELLQILLSQEHQDFTSSIQKLERTLYENESTPLKHIKQEALKEIQ